MAKIKRQLAISRLSTKSISQVLSVNQPSVHSELMHAAAIDFRPRCARLNGLADGQSVRHALENGLLPLRIDVTVP